MRGGTELFWLYIFILILMQKSFRSQWIWQIGAISLKYQHASQHETKLHYLTPYLIMQRKVVKRSVHSVLLFFFFFLFYTGFKGMYILFFFPRIHFFQTRKFLRTCMNARTIVKLLYHRYSTSLILFFSLIPNKHNHVYLYF